MNNTLGLISAFIGGAVVGAGAALLFAPEKGEDLRRGTRVDAPVEKLTRELDD